MHIEDLRLRCLAKAGATESLPFGPDVLVFKVGGKMFALVPLNAEDARINLKCDPERALELRERFPDEVLPGYHMNKHHWNTVRCEAGLSTSLIQDLIDHSYALILDSLPVAKRPNPDEE